MTKRKALTKKSYVNEFITDKNGKKVGVVLALDSYNELMEDLQDLAVIAERRDDDFVPFKNIK